MEDRPLISICFTCYNRKTYVEESLRSVLAQTYSPLEIVVSDNCSIDGTRETVAEMIRDYQASGGKHRIVFNVNESNIGGLKNIEKALSLCSGELAVFASDDDVSLPNRVEAIANRWLDTNKKATAIVHGWFKINSDGRYVGEQGPWGHSDFWNVISQGEDCLVACWPHGAAAAVVPAVVRKFPPVDELSAYEDYCWLYRAMMFGVPCLYMQDRLIKYRIGSGISSSFCVRDTQKRSGLGGLSAGKQALKDLEYYKDKMSEKWYNCIKNVIENHNADCEDVIACFSATGILEKLRLLLSRNLMLQNTLPRIYLAPLLLLPNKIGDPLINAATSVLWRYRAWKYRNHPLNRNH